METLSKIFKQNSLSPLPFSNLFNSQSCTLFAVSLNVHNFYKCMFFYQPPLIDLSPAKLDNRRFYEREVVV